MLQLWVSNQWTVGSFDVRTAFLRGSFVHDRNARVLGLEPPPELREQMKLRPRGAYRLANAPLLRFKELCLNRVGF